MKSVFRAACIGFAALCLFFGLLPLAVYGIFHTGVFFLLLYGGGLLLLCLCWDVFDGQGKIRRSLRPVSDRRRLDAPRWWKRSRMAAAAGLAAFTVWGCGMSVWMTSYAYLNPPPADAAVIVLGCQVVGDKPSKMLRLRLDAAYDYLQAHPRAFVIGSGGLNDGGTHSEAEVMRLYLAGRGIDPARVLLEDRSRNTRENLAFSAALIEAHNLPRVTAIATDGFHQLRGAIYAKKAGLIPYSLPAPTPWGLFPAYWVREWFGIAKAVILD